MVPGARIKVCWTSTPSSVHKSRSASRSPSPSARVVRAAKTRTTPAIRPMQGWARRQMFLRQEPFALQKAAINVGRQCLGIRTARRGRTSIENTVPPIATSGQRGSRRTLDQHGSKRRSAPHTGDRQPHRSRLVWLMGRPASGPRPRSFSRLPNPSA